MSINAVSASTWSFQATSLASTELVSRLDLYDAAMVAAADAKVSDETRASWADMSNPQNQSFWESMGSLTAADKAVIKAATGYEVPVPGSGARPAAPLLVLIIAADRQSGKLAANELLTIDYFTEMIKQQMSQDDPFGDQFQQALDYLTVHHASAFDATA